MIKPTTEQLETLYELQGRAEEAIYQLTYFLDQNKAIIKWADDLTNDYDGDEDDREYGIALSLMSFPENISDELGSTFRSN